MPVQKLSFASDFEIAMANASLAVAQLETKWTALTQTEKDSWAAATVYADKDLDGKQMFLAYFMGSFIADYSDTTAYATATLGNGTDGLYTNRATRTWTTT